MSAIHLLGRRSQAVRQRSAKPFFTGVSEMDWSFPPHFSLKNPKTRIEWEGLTTFKS